VKLLQETRISPSCFQFDPRCLFFVCIVISKFYNFFYVDFVKLSTLKFIVRFAIGCCCTIQYKCTNLLSSCYTAEVVVSSNESYIKLDLLDSKFLLLTQITTQFRLVQLNDFLLPSSCFVPIQNHVEIT